MARESVIMFYKLGPDKQKASDFKIVLKRPDEKKLKEYSEDSKKNVREFMEDIDKRYKAFKKEIYQLTKPKKASTHVRK